MICGFCVTQYVPSPAQELSTGVWFPSDRKPEANAGSSPNAVEVTYTAARRWFSRVTAELAAGDPSGDAWVDYWVSNGGRADYQRATQGHFDPGSHTLTLTFDVPATRRGGIELGVIGSYDQEGRSFSAHAWAPLKYCFTRFPD